MAWKYIVMQVGNREVPIIFPDHLVHKGIAQAMKLYFGQLALSASSGMMTRDALKKLIKDLQPVSAGSITFDVGKCAGKSDSLGVRSRPSDTDLIENFEYTHGLTDGNEETDYE